jgi:hypothetical protein
VPASLRPELRAILRTLVDDAAATKTDRLDLNTLAGAIGVTAVSAPELDLLFTELEKAGIQVESAPSPSLLPLLGQVLEVARTQRAHGLPAACSDIARTLGVDEHQVRAALLFARTLR